MRSYLDIPPGLVTDETDVTVGSAAWKDGDKMRFYRKRPQTIGGWERLIATNVDGVCRTVLPFTDLVGALVIGFGTHTKLQAYRGGGLFDITPAGLLPGAEHGTGTAGYSTGAYSVGEYSEPSTDAYYARTWSLDTYGASLMACPRGETIYTTDDVNTLATGLTGAPAEVTFMLVTESRQVMALGCNEEISGDFNPLCIRFSDIEDPDDWVTTSSNNAGEVILKGGGRLVGGRRVGRYVWAWTDNALYLGEFIGDPSQTWRFDLVAEHCGLLGPNAVVVVVQTAFWTSPDGQFWVCDLGGKPSVLPCSVRNDFADNLSASQADKVVASSCATFSEVRFDYPDQRDGFENSRYLAICTADGSWARGQMARSAYVDAGPSVSPLGVAPTGEVYWHERGNSADGSPLSWFIESADQYIDGERRCMRVNDVEPDFEGQFGPVTMTVYTKDYPQAEAEPWDAIILAAGETVQDFRAEGRFIRTRFEGSAVPSFVRLGRTSFDVVETGRR